MEAVAEVEEAEIEGSEVAEPPMLESLIARLALLNEHGWWTTSTDDPLVWEYLGVVTEVAAEENAMKLRYAQILAYAKGHDVGDVGYPSWTAFMKAFSPWGESRTRELLRLVESHLDVIKEALSKREIRLTAATRAMRELGGKASPEDQRAWLEGGSAGAPLPSGRRNGDGLASRRRTLTEVLVGDDMRRMLRARDLSSRLIGWNAGVADLDAFMVDVRARQLTEAQILDLARAAPPKPERLGKAVPEWKDDPASGLLGPWVQPTDIRDAVAQLQALELLLDKRRVLLAIAYDHILEGELWRGTARSLADLCLNHLDISQRTFQRYAKEGQSHRWYPEARKEIEAGRLSADRGAAALERAGWGEGASFRGAATREEMTAWLELVRRLERTELARALARGAPDPMREYAPAVEIARRVEEALRRDGPTDDGLGTVERIAAHLRKEGFHAESMPKGGIQVALRGDRNHRRAPERKSILVPEHLLAAADYLLATVKQLPKERGVRKVVAHDGYVCQNPRCRRRSLRVQPHHMEQRQHGGTDHPWNVLPLCPACHQRGVHANRISVVRIADWLVWTWRDGSVVIMGSSLRDLLELAA